MTLLTTAQQLVSNGKGILASDESINTLNHKFSALHIATTAEMRRKYREIFITTANLSSYLNGIILAEETIQQQTSSNLPFVEVLKQKNVLVGVKLDQGTLPVPRFPGELITLGLDELEAKLKFYRGLGAKFAKWRAVFHFGDGIPSDAILRANSQALSIYALFCQEHDIVPILEPELVMAGSHSATTCESETLRMLVTLFREIDRFRVQQDQLIVKTNMVLPGTENNEQKSPEEVAQMTVGVLKQGIPDEVPGVVFLSGGQTAEEALPRLNAIMKYPNLPWKLTFSFLRAIEQPSLEAWQGKDENSETARQLFETALKKTTTALKGDYQPT